MIETINKNDLAYLAGFIDGEGCFVINKRDHIGHKGKKYCGFSAYIDLTNTNLEVIEWIIKTFDLNIKWYRQDQPGNRKRAFRIRIGYKKAAPLTELLKEFLIVKKNHVPFFLKFGNASSEEKNVLWQEMKKLNQRGIVDHIT